MMRERVRESERVRERSRERQTESIQEKGLFASHPIPSGGRERAEEALALV